LRDRIVDGGTNEAALAESEETDIRRTAPRDALRMLDARARGIFAGRRLSGDPITIEARPPPPRGVARRDRAPAPGAAALYASLTTSRVVQQT
jgi:hypothetical protein